MQDQFYFTDESDSDQSRSDDHTDLLDQDELFLHERSLPLILIDMDAFVSQSRGNSSIESLHLHACSWNEVFLNKRVWESLGEVIGNLQALETIFIICDDVLGNGVIPDWGGLAFIIRHVRQNVRINMNGHYQWDAEEMLPFVQAIHGHPTITGFDVNNSRFPYESMSMFYSTLATLPALKSIHLHALEPDDGSTIANPNTLTKLLRIPTLRTVTFSCFYFTRALCQATANALTEGTEITDLQFDDCKFSDLECAIMMASGLIKTKSVANIRVEDPNLSAIFSAFGKSTELPTLVIDKFQSMDESLCTAIEYGLGTNETLGELELLNIRLRDDNFALWCRALSFLRVNKTLRVLTIVMVEGVTKSCASAFRMHIAAMLQENVALMYISIISPGDSKAEEYVEFLPALKNNTTLMALRLDDFYRSPALTDNDDKQIASLLKKNYGLEIFPNIDVKDHAVDVGTILRLNGAGRRYLIQDGSSISKGVEVLSRVNDDINCVFLHLLENPRLCDRRILVEMVITGGDNSRASSPTANSGGGKREQANAQHEGKESRIRLA
jgi:hypothetical protein